MGIFQSIFKGLGGASLVSKASKLKALQSSGSRINLVDNAAPAYVAPKMVAKSKPNMVIPKEQMGEFKNLDSFGVINKAIGSKGFRKGGQEQVMEFWKQNPKLLKQSIGSGKKQAQQFKPTKRIRGDKYDNYDKIESHIGDGTLPHKKPRNVKEFRDNSIVQKGIDERVEMGIPTDDEIIRIATEKYNLN